MGNVLSLALAVGVPLAGGTVIGISLAPEIKSWYPTIKKPRWNPPNWIFGPVWTLLYTGMGVASWRVWRAGGGALPLSLYGVQLVLNLLWSPIFFQKHDLKLACADITALLGVLAATIFEFHKVDPTAAYLLLPYLAWSSFATALTYNIALNNTKNSSVLTWRCQGGAKVKRAAESAAERVGEAAAEAVERVEGAASEATAAAAHPFLAQASERQSSEVPKQAKEE